MGYNTIAVKKGSTTGVAVQFDNLTSTEIPIKSLVTVAAPVGGTSAGAGDQVWTYDGFNWNKYFHFSSRGVDKWLVAGQGANDEETKATISVGQSFFFVRCNSTKSSDTTITLSGGLVPLTSVQSYSVKKGSTTAMAYPWPETMKVKNFHKFIAAPVGGTSAGAGDQVWTYDGYNWTKYFRYSSRGVEKWLMAGQGSEDTETEAEIIPGQAFFFVRCNSTKSSDTTVDFSRDKNM